MRILRCLHCRWQRGDKYDNFGYQKYFSHDINQRERKRVIRRGEALSLTLSLGQVFVVESSDQRYADLARVSIPIQ